MHMHTIQNKIYLHVITYNKDAISFYGRSGFQCVRELPDYYCVNHNLYNSYLCIRHIAGASPPVRFRWFRRFAKSVMTRAASWWRNAQFKPFRSSIKNDSYKNKKA
jgi:hypothetical protein